jgi:hypothetical protein
MSLSQRIDYAVSALVPVGRKCSESRGKRGFRDEFYLYRKRRVADGRGPGNGGPHREVDPGAARPDQRVILHMTVLEAMLVVDGFLVLAAVVAQFSPNTRGRYYEEISP